MAESQGQITDVFNETIADLTGQAGAQGGIATNGEGLRPWNMPTSPDWSGNPLDIAGTVDAFDRTELGSLFEGLLKAAENPGTVGDAISLKVQNDYVAVCERGFRARHCTPVRLLAMSAGRRIGHGDMVGIFQGGVMIFAQNALRNGQS